jgi:diguanylate cyclase (GGDEF)-like protein/PAS domain S-box-containing protein
MDPTRRSDESGPAARLEPLETEALDTLLDAMLAAEPPPIVLAFEETGLCVPVPPEVPILSRRMASGIASGLELCVPEDVPAILQAWERARRQRAAQAMVHPRHAPEHCVPVHFVDARHRFGVYLGIVTGLPEMLCDPTAQPLMPRAKVCTLERDEFSRVRAVGATVAEILGWTADDLLGHRTLSLTHPDDRPIAITNWLETLARPGNGPRTLIRYRARTGRYIWLEVTHCNLLADPARHCVVSEMVDVSERMEAVDALRTSEKLLRRLTESLPLGIIQIDAARRIVYRNNRLLAILGQTAAATLDEHFTHVAPADRGPLDGALAAVLAGREPPDLELTVDEPGGARRCSVTMLALGAYAGVTTGAIVSVADITERVRLREELERRARYDELTRCQNRASILQALDGVMLAQRTTGTGAAVIFVDLDHFKETNDRYGHAAGDELLRLTGQRLLACVRGDDIVGRLGGDEFLVVCPNLDTPAVALALADRIDAALAETATLGAATITSGASIGVAWTSDAIGCDAIVALADQAMYESKRSGRGPVLASR